MASHSGKTACTTTKQTLKWESYEMRSRRQGARTSFLGAPPVWLTKKTNWTHQILPQLLPQSQVAEAQNPPKLPGQPLGSLTKCLPAARRHHHPHFNSSTQEQKQCHGNSPTQAWGESQRTERIQTSLLSVSSSSMCIANLFSISRTILYNKP